MADEDAKILAAALKLPMAERAEHKNWKVRSALFEDIREKCGQAFSPDDPVIAEAGEFMWWQFVVSMGVHGTQSCSGVERWELLLAQQT